MKLAIQTNAWGDERHRQELPNVIAEIAAAGYQGFEIGAHRFDLEQPTILRDLAQNQGLQVAGLHTFGELYNPEAMKAIYPRIEKVASVAAVLAAPFVMISGSLKPGKTADDQQIEAESLNQAGTLCARHGVSLCYHNHYWEIEHNCKELQFLVNHTDPTLVGLAVDVGWVHRAGGRPAEVVRRFLDRIRYFHFKDFRVKNFQSDTWAELGTGYIDFPGVLSVIRGRDYWLTVERDETMPNAAESAQVSIDYLRSIL